MYASQLGMKLRNIRVGNKSGKHTTSKNIRLPALTITYATYIVKYIASWSNFRVMGLQLHDQHVPQ